MRGRLWSEFDGLLFCLAEFPSDTIPHDRGDRGSALHTEAITHTHARASSDATVDGSAALTCTRITARLGPAARIFS